MAPWYALCGQDDFEPEIRVGLYDQWVHLIEAGVTQLDRATVHTGMMELAHERRFLISQTCQDMSTFEEKHREHVGYTITLLERPFEGHELHNSVDATSLVDDDDLLGLTPYPTMFQPVQNYEIDPLSEFTDAQALGKELERIAPRTGIEDSTTLSHSGTKPPSHGHTIDLGDADDVSDDAEEDWQLETRRFTVESRRKSFSRPRQMRAPRVRTRHISRPKDFEERGAIKRRRSSLDDSTNRVNKEGTKC